MISSPVATCNSTKGDTTHFCCSFLFISVAFPCWICSASQQLFQLQACSSSRRAPPSLCHLTLVGSGRIAKQTSRTSLTNGSSAASSSAANSTSRLRPHYNSSNQNCRSKLTQSRLDVPSTRLDATCVATVRNSVAVEEERIRQLGKGETDAEEDLESVHTSLVARREEQIGSLFPSFHLLIENRSQGLSQ